MNRNIGLYNQHKPTSLPLVFQRYHYTRLQQYHPCLTVSDILHVKVILKHVYTNHINNKLTKKLAAVVILNMFLVSNKSDRINQSA